MHRRVKAGGEESEHERERVYRLETISAPIMSGNTALGYATARSGTASNGPLSTREEMSVRALWPKLSRK